MSSPALVDVLTEGQAIEIRAELLPEYTEGDAILTDIVASSQQGLHALIGWMPEY